MEHWFYDEFAHCGVDYSLNEQADGYNANHQTLRNYDAEYASMRDLIGLKDISGMTVLDIGCGTGITAVQLAADCKRVIALDVSEAMLIQARSRAAQAGVANIDFVHAGFLTYTHESPLADIVITKTALHHLPDFWKQVALDRINGMLKPGGVFYMLDVVFNFDAASYRERITAWIEKFAKVVPPAFVREIETHISSEFSTFRWIMDGMLEKSGFSIEHWRSGDDFIAEYVCRSMAK